MQRDEELLIALRRVIRAIDLRSKQLSKDVGLTGPQLLVLQNIGRMPGIMVRQIADNINLSPATVTSILDRLETRSLAQRVRSTEDKRRVGVFLTPEGEKALDAAPMNLQEHFINRFSKLADWEQSQMVSTMQRIASMMDADELDASPVLDISSSLEK